MKDTEENTNFNNKVTIIAARMNDAPKQKANYCTGHCDFV
jgi:hypothetical protein